MALGGSGELGEHATRMRASFQRRTGAFGPEDPWFEPRAKAFWDDAIATQGFGLLAARTLDDDVQRLAACMSRAHRGFFLVDSIDSHGACLYDVWSGAELLVRPLDETQALALAHAEGAMDARVTASPSGSDLYLLPGAFYHPADTLEPALDVLLAARSQGLSTGQTLDALMRMELVFRSSSRVKAGFAYRASSLTASESSAPGR